MTPTVSVVIPTYNRVQRLAEVLTGLARQTYPAGDTEIVVVSDGSTDGTDDYLRSSRPPVAVHAVFQANSGPAVARNVGVRAAVGRIIIFLDDDVVPSASLVDAHLRAHRESGTNAVVIGPMLTPSDFRMSPWVRWEQAMLYKQYNAMRAGMWSPTPRQFYTGNASLAREHIIATGGFDPTFRRAEDVEFARRLAERGLHFVFEEAACGFHYADRSFASWRNNAYAYGRNDAIFGRDHGRRSVLEVIQREFRGHHFLVRFVARACVGHPRRAGIVAEAFRWGAVVADAARLRGVDRYVLSGLYNLLYYRGLTDELGDEGALLFGPRRGSLRESVGRTTR